MNAPDAKWNVALQRLDEHIAVLRVMAVWCEDLDEKLERAQLKRCLIGLDADEEHLLEVEAAEFKQICRVLIDSLQRRRRV